MGRGGCARSNNSLTGSLPESYAALSQLQELWAVQNNLTGPLPPSYSNLSNLAAVELWSNSLTGGPWVVQGCLPLSIKLVYGLAMRSNWDCTCVSLRR